jgi:hypothetical protein
MEPFGTPVLLDPFATPTIELTPELSYDGRTLWVSFDRADSVGSFDIYYATRACLD